MAWWETALVALLPIGYLGITIRVLVWVLTKAQFTLIEMVCANLVGLVWTTGFLYVYTDYYSKSPDGYSWVGVLAMMFLGYTFALFSSATGWFAIKERSLALQPRRFQMLAMHWALWLGAIMLPIVCIRYTLR